MGLQISRWRQKRSWSLLLGSIHFWGNSFFYFLSIEQQFVESQNLSSQIVFPVGSNCTKRSLINRNFSFEIEIVDHSHLGSTSDNP